MKKTQSNKQRNNTHQYKETKEMIDPVSFIYVRTTFEHQVQDMYASQTVQAFSSPPQATKHISDTSRSTNQHVHQQVPLLSFKLQVLEQTE